MPDAFWRCQECGHLLSLPIPQPVSVTEFEYRVDVAGSPSEFIPRTMKFHLCRSCEDEAFAHALRHRGPKR